MPETTVILLTVAVQSVVLCLSFHLAHSDLLLRIISRIVL